MERRVKNKTGLYHEIKQGFLVVSQRLFSDFVIFLAEVNFKYNLRVSVG